MTQDRKFRPDIGGLRAIAVLLVLLAHFGFVFKGGYVGVDVFFVISGFLITGILYKELLRDNKISFSNFYARRIRRILPIATVVIAVTVLASWLWLPSLRMSSIGLDAVFASFSGINYRLAVIGTDYFAQDGSISPLQHLWSLSVEEQFYLIWPALIFILSVRAIKKESLKKRASIVLAVLIGLSLLASYWLTRVSQPWAYFGLLTRAWELAFGALLAINIETIRKLPKILADISSWLGLIMIFLAAILFTELTPFPGLAALLPVLGVVLVIASNTETSRWSSEWLLSLRPLQFIGEISYSLYLWHWPILIILPEAIGAPLTASGRIIAMVGAILLSVATFYFIEQPFRNSKVLSDSNKRAYLLGAILMILTLIVSLPFIINFKQRAVMSQITPISQEQGVVERAVSDATKAVRLPENLVVPLNLVPKDMAPRNCIEKAEVSLPTKEATCNLGALNSSNIIVLFGDSHANQWIESFTAIAKDNNYKLITYTKTGCPPFEANASNPISKRNYTECYSWRKEAAKQIKEIQPDYVVIAALTSYSRDEGLGKLVETLNSAKTKVIYLLDTPHPGKPVPDCLSKNKTSIQGCSLTAGLALQRDNRDKLDKMATKKGAFVVDPEPWFCADSICPVVIDNVVVYNDDSHISATYAKYLTSVLEKSIPGL